METTATGLASAATAGAGVASPKDATRANRGKNIHDRLFTATTPSGKKAMTNRSTTSYPTTGRKVSPARSLGGRQMAAVRRCTQFPTDRLRQPVVFRRRRQRADLASAELFAITCADVDWLG